MEKKYIAEFLGTFFLVATVIGSGIMGDDLSAGNEAVAFWGLDYKLDKKVKLVYCVFFVTNKCHISY